jgi:hypothetical protein
MRARNENGKTESSAREGWNEKDAYHFFRPAWRQRSRAIPLG